jgi:SAM-dependent methyltransferase
MKDRDAFGREIHDHQLGREHGCEIVERDDGFIDTSGGPEAYFTSFVKWPTHEKKAMTYAAGHVLDIGCGAGRTSLYLQKKGLRVTATDASPLAIKTCKLRGVRDARVIPIEKLSPRIGTFDAVVMMGNNFGLFGGEARGRRLLRVLHRMTSKDARIIAESTDPYTTTNPCHLRYHAFNRRRGRMAGQLRIRVRYQDITSAWFDYLLAAPDEMRNILKGTGWKIERLIRAANAPQYIAVICRVARPARSS